MFISAVLTTTLLRDFEEIGVTCEKIDVLHRTKKYTECYCKLSKNEKDAYTVLRVYRNGIACMMYPIMDENNNMVGSLELRKRSDKVGDGGVERNQYTEREKQLHKYQFVGFIVFLALIACVVLMLFGKLGTIEGLICLAFLIVYNLIRRFVWYERILWMGHKDIDYYEKYK